MTLKKIALVFSILVAGASSYAVAPVPVTADEYAIEKVKLAVVTNDLKFVTSSTEDVCGATGIPGIDVKVQIEASAGRLITLRHYGVTEANMGKGFFGLFARSQTIECAR